MDLRAYEMLNSALGRVVGAGHYSHGWWSAPIGSGRYEGEVRLAGQGGGVRAPARLLGGTGEFHPAAGPLERGPRVGFGQVGGGLREDTGQHAAADVARRVEAEAEGLGDV